MKKFRAFALVALLVFVFSISAFAECQGGTVPIGGRCLVSEPAETEPEVKKDAEEAEDIDIFDALLKFLRAIEIIS